VRLTARVPATVANLGPGFDCFALALALHNEIVVDTEADPGVVIEGEGAGELPTDEGNLVVQAMHYLAQEFGELPSFSMHCTNHIPLERGLGSSAAAVVGGLLVADRLLDAGLSRDGLLERASELEGHADNAAGALLGGVAIAYLTDDGWRGERLDPVDGLRPVVLVSETERVSTDRAREVLDPKVDRTDAAFNAARTALLSLALTERTDLLGVALGDRLHQSARLELAPVSKKLFEGLESAGVPVCVAGSGPTLLAFETDERPVPDPGTGWRVLRLGIDQEGATVLEAGVDDR
jgi:homoserine kinase